MLRKNIRDDIKKIVSGKTEGTTTPGPKVATPGPKVATRKGGTNKKTASRKGVTAKVDSVLQHSFPRRSKRINPSLAQKPQLPVKSTNLSSLVKRKRCDVESLSSGSISSASDDVIEEHVDEVQSKRVEEDVVDEWENLDEWGKYGVAQEVVGVVDKMDAEQCLDEKGGKRDSVLDRTSLGDDHQEMDVDVQYTSYPQTSISKENADIFSTPPVTHNPKQSEYSSGKTMQDHYDVGEQTVTGGISIPFYPSNEPTVDNLCHPPANIPEGDDERGQSKSKVQLDPICTMVVFPDPYCPPLMDTPHLDADVPPVTKITKRIPRPSHYLDENEYAGDPRLKGLFGSRKKKPRYNPIPEVDEIEFQTFQKVLGEDMDQSFTISTGHTLSNADFLDIATPGKAVTFYHMRVLMALIWTRRGHEYIKNQIAVIDPSFIDLLATHHDKFNECEDKDNYNWGTRIKFYVTGKSTGKGLKTKFMKDVEFLYVPMNWGNHHWVGLVISLELRHIEILDPLPQPITDYAPDRVMAPVTELLPWLLKRFINPALTPMITTTPFTFHVSRPSLCNTDGDCGPMVARLLEMHAHGLGEHHMSAISTEMLHDSRKAYAMDAYLAFVRRRSDDMYFCV